MRFEWTTPPASRFRALCMYVCACIYMSMCIQCPCIHIGLGCTASASEPGQRISHSYTHTHTHAHTHTHTRTHTHIRSRSNTAESRRNCLIEVEGVDTLVRPTVSHIPRQRTNRDSLARNGRAGDRGRDAEICIVHTANRSCDRIRLAHKWPLQWPPARATPQCARAGAVRTARRSVDALRAGVCVRSMLRWERCAQPAPSGTYPAH